MVERLRVFRHVGFFCSWLCKTLTIITGGSRRGDGFHRLLSVKVLEIRGTNVKLGFEVDPDVPVHRSEVWERVHSDAGQIA